MKKILTNFATILAAVFICTSMIAQEADTSDTMEEEVMEKESPLSISGSVDIYYKMDFAGNAARDANISGGENYTFFAPDHNSFSIGMANIILEKAFGKSAMVADVSFGPRGGSSSIPTQSGSDGSFHIQNLYVTHAFSDAISITAGYMGTFVGYEVISPAANFNYSTSHMFSWGPFQNAGVKLNVAVTDKIGFMVGLFNDWNTYTDFTGGKDLGLQLSYNISDGSDVYLNFIAGADSGLELDLTAALQISDAFYLGVNAATYSNSEGKFLETGESGFSGVALYPQFTISDGFSIGLRSEIFSEKQVNDIFSGTYSEKASVFSNTITANIKAGPLTIIPELRFDTGSQDIYVDSDGNATGSAAQFLIAAVYAF